MAATTPAAFLCYPNQADQGPGISPDEEGPISRLRSALVREVRTLSGEGQFDIFMDRRSLSTGDDWEARLREGLDQASVLIVLVQPLLFTSEWCRQEVMRFREAEEKAKRNDLIVPVYYVDVPGFDKAAPDPVMRLLAGRQYRDWRRLRNRGPQDREWVDGVEALAQDVLRAFRRGLGTPVAAAPPPPLPGAGPGRLYTFLLRAFSVDELGRFLRWNYPDVLLEVSAGGSPAAYAQQVVDVLDRRGSIQGPLFDALARERPRRAEEVAEIRKAFGV